MPRPEIALDLDLHPDDLPALLRQPELFAPGSRRRLAKGRTSRVSLMLHDTAEGELAAQGVILGHASQRGAPWQLLAIVPQPGEIAPPGAAVRVVAESEAPPENLAATLLPVAALDYSERELLPAGSPARVVLRQGAIRTVAAQSALCRVSLQGAGAAALAAVWAARLRLSVASESLPARALRLAGRMVPTRPLGAPLPQPGVDVSDGLAAIAAHLAGAMAHHALLADGTHGPEPVHQMRVALRRLRSAITLFRRAIACPAVDAVNAALRQAGHVLGPARDWDVFVLGTGSEVAESFADDAAVQDLLAAARRRQSAAYVSLRAYLAGPEWRVLGIALAGLVLERPWERPWESVAPDADETTPEAATERSELLALPLEDFAARALSRRFRSLTDVGADLSALDVPALHALRLKCKRMRYACEFFAPLHPGRATKRFLRRLADLQERLGTLNDASVAAGLMAQLAGRGSARAQAIGIVRGYVAAHAGADRSRIEKAWRRLLKQPTFWP